MGRARLHTWSYLGLVYRECIPNTQHLSQILTASRHGHICQDIMSIFWVLSMTTIQTVHGIKSGYSALELYSTCLNPMTVGQWMLQIPGLKCQQFPNLRSFPDNRSHSVSLSMSQSGQLNYKIQRLCQNQILIKYNIKCPIQHMRVIGGYVDDLRFYSTNHNYLPSVPVFQVLTMYRPGCDPCPSGLQNPN